MNVDYKIRQSNFTVQQLFYKVQKGKKTMCSLKIKSLLKPCIFITNDDGVDSPLTLELAKQVKDRFNIETVAVCPLDNTPGKSMSITSKENILVKARRDLGQNVFQVNGTPTDCTLIALDKNGLLQSLNYQPILCLSGVNYGPNLGAGSQLSGTVNAAKMAAQLGLPAIAFSRLNKNQDQQIKETIDVSLDFVSQILQHKLPKNCPRLDIKLGQRGRRFQANSIQYQNNTFQDMDQSQKIKVCNQILLDALLEGDIFFNVNLSKGLKKDRYSTTILSLILYNKLVQQLNNQDTPIQELVDQGVDLLYTFQLDNFYVEKIQQCDIDLIYKDYNSITPLQAWSDGHALSLSEEVMQYAYIQGEKGFPNFLQLN